MTQNNGPKYPDISVQLTGEDGNAFAVIASVSKALKRGGAGPDEVASFRTQALDGDYDHVLQTCMAWVDVS